MADQEGRYAVTMRHDDGMWTGIIWADDAENAAERVCAIELAPRRAVVKVERLA